VTGAGGGVVGVGVGVITSISSLSCQSSSNLGLARTLQWGLDELLADDEEGIELEVPVFVH
jgi:hypothetical protein